MFGTKGLLTLTFNRSECETLLTARKGTRVLHLWEPRWGGCQHNF